MPLVNTRYFQETGLNFKKNNRIYTLAPKGTREYKDFWTRERDRCINGYTVAGMHITGRNYFYLNFSPIERLADTALKQTNQISSIVETVYDFPNFWEIQYNWWWAKDIAWKGMDLDRYHDLDLRCIQMSPENLIGGKHIACAKTRGCGFSYMEAADGAYNFTFLQNSKSFYFASKEDYLIGDGILPKVWSTLNFLRRYTEFGKLRQKSDSKWEKRASYLDSKGIERGMMSQVMGIVLDDPNKVRGNRGVKLTFEEAGSFKHLTKAISMARPLVEQGGFLRGQISVFGCVCAGTEVYKANGHKILIEDLKQEDGILGYNGREAFPETITYIQPPAKKECVEITLESGQKLRCSKDHPILSTYIGWKQTKNYSRKIAFIPAEHLDTSYMVAVIEELPYFGTLNIKESYTLGYLLGDGYYGGTIEIIVDNENSLNKIKYDCNKIELKREYSESLKSYSIGGNIRSIVKENKMWGQSKQNKRFPYNWKDYNKETLSQFIAGYFDADGNIKVIGDKGITICFSSIVVEILDSLKEALLKFGIHCNIQKELSKGGYTEFHTIYRLYINRAISVENFKNNIFPLNPKKQIPSQTKRVCQILRDAKYHSNKPYGEYYKDKLLTGAILYKIKSIVDIGEQYIYNITASNTHTYIANNIITHNTGGEEGEGIEGLESIFYEPAVYNMLEFDNIWDGEDMEGTSCGFFVPATLATDKFINEEGIADIKGALLYWQKERDKAKKSSDPKELDRLTAERPIRASEVFNRVMTNIFNVNETKRQIGRIKMNRDIQGLIQHGILLPKKKRPIFELADVKPLLKFPHKNTDDLTGAVTIYERPFTDDANNIPNNLYILVVDPFYKDEAEDRTSLGCVYVIIRDNNITGRIGERIVASYVARPKLEEFHKNLFLLAQMYNTKIQSEVAGGGVGIIDYAKREKLMHLLEYEPEMVHNKELASNVRNKSYFMNMTMERKKQGLFYFAEWLMRVIGFDEEGEPIYNINRIYDLALLEEIRKFNDKGNFDRISTMILAMYMLKEKAAIEIEESREQNSIFNRAFFTDYPVSNMLSPEELGLGTQLSNFD